MLKQLGYLLTAAVIAFLGAATVSFAQNLAPPIDYSKSYGMQGLPRSVAPPVERQRDIIDLSPSVSIGGVLGCAGLEIDAMMRDVLGVGNIDASAIADQMMQNLQSQFAQQMLTQVMADPTISSIQQQISAMANARLTMMKAECNAMQAKDDAMAIVRAEAQQRCFQKYGVNDTRCEDGTLLRESVEEIVSEPRWNKTFQEQICDREKENCEWLRVLPDYKPKLTADNLNSSSSSSSSSSGGDSSSGSDSSGGDSDDSSGGDTGEGGSSSSSSSGAQTNNGSKEVQPAAISLFELRDGVREDMLDEIALRTASATSAVERFGFYGALRYANTGNEPTSGTTEDAEQQNDTPPPANSSGGINTSGGNTAENADERGTAIPFSLKDVAQSASCVNFTLEAPDAFSQNPNETKDTSAPIQAVGVPEAVEPPPPSSDSGWVWPTDHRKITSRYGPRNISNGGSPNHSGTDIRAYEGNPIYAMIGGKITKADNQPTSGTGSSCGNTIMLVSGPWRLGHCHLSAFRVRAGDVVQAGQVIGLSGATSNGRIRNMAAHLHLTVRHNGVRKDPEDTVLAMATGTAPEMPDGGDGPDEYGNPSYAHSITSSSPPDSAFVRGLHDDLRRLTLRVGQTADCMLNREIDPHVYVRMALLPTVMRESMIDTLAETMAHRAIITTFNSVIQQLALSLARKSGGGENAMNEATIRFAKQQIDLLKNMRDALESDYTMKEELSVRMTEMNDYVEKAQQRLRRRR